MSLSRDLRVIKSLVLQPLKKNSSTNRIENFYSSQALDYDYFRKKLLPGRERLIENLEIPQNASILDIGGGTGFLLDALGERLSQCRAIDVVDLSPSLLKVGQKKAKDRGLQNVTFFEIDFLSFYSQKKYDIILFSYSLSMIPAWKVALFYASDLLSQHGKIAVVDFYISSQHPRWMKVFWPRWFQHDHVYLNEEHFLTLKKHFECLYQEEALSVLPYLPYLKVPYYLYIGKKSNPQNLGP